MIRRVSSCGVQALLFILWLSPRCRPAASATESPRLYSHLRSQRWGHKPAAFGFWLYTSMQNIGNMTVLSRKRRGRGLWPRCTACTVGKDALSTKMSGSAPSPSEDHSVLRVVASASTRALAAEATHEFGSRQVYLLPSGLTVGWETSSSSAGIFGPRRGWLIMRRVGVYMRLVAWRGSSAEHKGVSPGRSSSWCFLDSRQADSIAGLTCDRIQLQHAGGGHGRRLVSVFTRLAAIVQSKERF